MDIDEQLQRAEERVKQLKKRKADMKLKSENAALRAELQDLKSRINAIENLNQLTVNSTDKNGQKFEIKVVKFDDILTILKR